MTSELIQSESTYHKTSLGISFDGSSMVMAGSLSGRATSKSCRAGVSSDPPSGIRGDSLILSKKVFPLGLAQPNKKSFENSIKDTVCLNSLAQLKKSKLKFKGGLFRFFRPAAAAATAADWATTTQNPARANRARRAAGGSSQKNRRTSKK